MFREQIKQINLLNYLSFLIFYKNNECHFYKSNKNDTYKNISVIFKIKMRIFKMINIEHKQTSTQTCLLFPTHTPCGKKKHTHTQHPFVLEIRICILKILNCLANGIFL